jgi:hypothetical protein
LRSERDDFVGANPQVPSTGLSIDIEKVINELEDLFHDSVLAHVIVALELQRVKLRELENSMA